jgi:O-antigen/teichoic acid export membrane protein
MKANLYRIQLILFPFLDILLQGLTYSFHFLVSRLLTVSEYGTLSAHFSLLALLLVVGSIAQSYVATNYAREKHQAIQHLRAFLFQSTFFSLLLLLLLFLLHDSLQGILRITIPQLLLLFLIYFFNLYVSIIRGYIQGMERFYFISGSLAVEVLTKIILVFIFMQFASITLILVASFLGMVMSLLFSLGVLRNIHQTSYKKTKEHLVPENTFLESTGPFPQEQSQAQRKNGASPFVQSPPFFLIYLFLYGFMTIEMLLVHYWMEESSGLFAVVIRVSQLLLFSTISIFTLFLPRLAHHSNNQFHFNRLVKKLFSSVILFQAIGILFFNFNGELLLELLFGDQYQGASKYLFLGNITYFLLSIVFLLLMLNLLQKKHHYLFLIIPFFLLELIGFYFFHENIHHILLVEIMIIATMATTLLRFNHRH